MVSQREILVRIEEALVEAKEVLSAFTPGAVEVAYKQGDDPVTKADNAVDDVLKRILPRGDEGWLSEETTDDVSRLKKKHIWIVDPLDGTREFVTGIPEWCVSIGFIEDGIPIAGGVYNPATDELFLGTQQDGISYNREPARPGTRTTLDGAVILASRSEIKRGEWERFSDQPFTVRPTGSIAYKLALVAAGLADATWTLVGKNEWDIAAGAALLQAAGGDVLTRKGVPMLFNQRPSPLLDGLIGTAPGLTQPVLELLEIPMLIP